MKHFWEVLLLAAGAILLAIVLTSTGLIHAEDAPPEVWRPSLYIHMPDGTLDVRPHKFARFATEDECKAFATFELDHVKTVFDVLVPGNEGVEIRCSRVLVERDA